MLFEVYTIVKV